VLNRQTSQLAAMGPNSGRNHALYTAAVQCGSYITGAGMNEREAVARLTDAATRNGLLAEDGPRSVAATIASGLRNGKANPKVVPEAADSLLAGIHPDTGEGTDDPDDGYEQLLAFHRAVDNETRRLRVQKTARERVAAEDAATVTIPRPVRLTDFLAIPDEPSAYRIDQVFPVGGRVVLSSQWKAGKPPSSAT
jgi:hypothetical protein